jgi:hypothetical protein
MDRSPPEISMPLPMTHLNMARSALISKKNTDRQIDMARSNQLWLRRPMQQMEGASN